MDFQEKVRVREAIYNVFPNIYFTIMSVIQGVAMAVLATKFISVFDINQLLVRATIYLILHSAMSFFGMIIVTFEYSYYVAIVRRPPMVTDIAIPIFLGMSQLGPLFFVDNPKVWWLLTATFAFVGSVAYLNTIWKIAKQARQTDYVVLNTVLDKTSLMRCAIQHLIITFTIFVVSFANFFVYQYQYSTVSSEIIAIVFITLLMNGIIYSSNKYLKKII